MLISELERAIAAAEVEKLGVEARLELYRRTLRAARGSSGDAGDAGDPPPDLDDAFDGGFPWEEMDE